MCKSNRHCQSRKLPTLTFTNNQRCNATVSRVCHTFTGRCRELRTCYEATTRKDDVPLVSVTWFLDPLFYRTTLRVNAFATLRVSLRYTNDTPTTHERQTGKEKETEFRNEIKEPIFVFLSLSYRSSFQCN